MTVAQEFILGHMPFALYVKYITLGYRTTVVLLLCRLSSDIVTLMRPFVYTHADINEIINWTAKR